MVQILWLSTTLTLLAALASLGRADDIYDLQRAKDAAVRQLSQSLGVDISQLRMVRRSGQNLQATNGWAYFNVYGSDDCSAPQGPFTVGIVTDVCLLSKPVNGTAYSYYYTCNNEFWTRQEFNNTNCDASGLSTTTNLNVTGDSVCGVFPPPIVGEDDDGGHGGNTTQIYYAAYNCSAASTVHLGNNYILNQYYDSDTCGMLGSFDGLLDGGCFPFAMDSGAIASVITDYSKSKQYLYLNGNCTGTVAATFPIDNLVKECSGTDDDAHGDDTDENAAMVWTGYTSALTCTVPDDTNCDPSSSDDDGLSDGAVAGAVIGSVAGAAVIGVGAFLAAKARGYFGTAHTALADAQARVNSEL
eukprot:gene27552-33278_t